MTRLLPALLLLALAGCEVFDPMISQQKVKTYRESEFWPDRISMRPPPPGTVAREDVMAPELATGRGPDGKALTRPPIPVTRKLLDQGRTRFDIHCAVCHGYLGDGASLVARNMAIRPPPSLLARAQQTDGWYFQVMSEGFGVMPSYASALTPEERWAIVAYIRALQVSQSARADRLTPEERARLTSPPSGEGR
ncbi:MAG TPA: cytochrome c [Anaeromyxobacteraceae bacterium]|nr:cytochrome c [Anaeromyxobacteraceae bacterium]